MVSGRRMLQAASEWLQTPLAHRCRHGPKPRNGFKVPSPDHHSASLLLGVNHSRDEPAAWPGYRSEAFAEDLVVPEAPSPVVRRTPRVLPVLLAGAPLLAAVLGGAAALFGHSF